MVGRGGDELPPMRGKWEAEVREEIEFYLEERAREFEAGGMAPEAARRAAGAAFGDRERVTEAMRRERRQRREEGRTMTGETWVWDARVVARGLLRRPTFTAVVVLTLGLGIGAVTAVFSVVNASLVRALPFADARELVFVQGAFDAPEGPQVRGGSPAEVRDWDALSRSFEGVAAFDGTGFTLTGPEGDAERLSGETVDQGYFEIVGVEPLLGRTFAAAEYEPGAAELPVLVGEALWTRRFARDPGLVGRTLSLDGLSFAVVGVLPESFRGMSLQADLWVPLAAYLDADDMADRGSRWLGAVARLGPGLTLEAARADMAGVAGALEQRYPDTNQDRIALVTPVREVFMGSTRSLMLVIMGATGVLLLIAVVNVTNLLLVRSWARSGETMMRQALGAGRSRLMSQNMIESLMLAGGGAVLGLVTGAWGAEALAGAMPPALLPPYVEVRPDGLVFALVVGLMALVALATGLVPALFGARADLAAGMRERGSGGRAAGRSPLQGLLVAGEVGLALLLLVGAGLMARSLRAQLAVEPGFDAQSLLAFRVDLPSERYAGAEARRAAVGELLGRLASGPGVSAVTLSSDAPLRGASSAAILTTDEGDERIRFYRHMVGPDFFAATGIDIVSGAAFEGFDAAATGDVAIISRAMAERHFGGTDPVGRTLRVGGADGLSLTIVGVAGDVRWRDLTTDLVGGPTDPDVYLPWARFPGGSVEVLVRAQGDPAALTPWVRDALRAFDPDLPPIGMEPMAEALATQTAQGRFGSLLLGAFSVMAALLAAVGLYGVLSFTVGRRTREIAVRMAMGADAGRVRRMVVLEGLRLAAVGLVVGVLVAWQASGALEAFLFGVRPVDPPTYLAVAALMVGVTAMAAWIPALRATRVEPHAALSAE